MLVVLLIMMIDYFFYFGVTASMDAVGTVKKAEDMLFFSSLWM